MRTATAKEHGSVLGVPPETVGLYRAPHVVWVCGGVVVCEGGGGVFVEVGPHSGRRGEEIFSRNPAMLMMS